MCGPCTCFTALLRIWRHVTVHRDKFLKLKATRCTNFSNLFLEWKSACFGQFLYPSSGVFHCTHSNGMCHTGLLCVQWKSPDDGQRNFPKHVDFHSKNKFEKLVRLVGFIVRNVLLRLAQSLVFAISSVDRPVWVMWLVDSCGWLMSVSVGWIIGVLVIRCYEIHAFLGRALRRHRSCAVMAVLRLCSPP